MKFGQIRQNFTVIPHRYFLSFSSIYHIILAFEQFPVIGGKLQTLTGAVVALVGAGGSVGKVGRVNGADEPNKLKSGANGLGVVVGAVSRPIGIVILVVKPPRGR